ncbi:hypothetical protein FACS189496_4920 [Bacilli bacterium]|nr:hypothetical protein FACS189496_4920 [Bacilli bacterium]
MKNGLNVRNLKWLVSSFCKYVFSKDTEVRFTMSNYSFTEPSFEAQATCPFCNGNGCGACKKTG